MAMYLAGFELDMGELMISPPPGSDVYRMFYDKATLERLKALVRDYLPQCGMVGTMFIFHQYRGRANHMEQIRRRDIQGQDAWHFQVYGLSAPRFVDGELNPEILSSTEFNELTADKDAEPKPTGRNGGYVTGWTYKWESEFTKSGKRRNVYKKIRYELDHAAISFDGHRYGLVNTWTGLLSHRAIKREVEVRQEAVYCDVCGQQAHRFFEDEDRGLSYHRCEEHHHQLTEMAIERARTRHKLFQGVRRYQTLEGVIGNV